MNLFIVVCHRSLLTSCFLIAIFETFQNRVAYLNDSKKRINALLRLPDPEHLFFCAQKLGLNERQIKAVMYVKEKGKITNKEYQGVCNISERTATRDLSNLVSLGLFMQIGVTGKGTEYILTRHKDAKDAIKTP